MIRQESINLVYRVFKYGGHNIGHMFSSLKFTRDEIAIAKRAYKRWLKS